MTDEETLDPGNWQELRDLGHRMVDDMLVYLETLRDRPVWQPMPEEVQARLDQPLPRKGQGAESAYQDFQDLVLPYPFGNIHPRHWGWVNGTGTPLGMLAEMLAAGMNPNTGGFNQAASAVESQVLGWCKQMLGYPADASGLLLSGGSMANLVGLTVARNVKAQVDVRRSGVGELPNAMTLYCSDETHSSVQKAVELLGLGSQHLRQLPADSDYRIELAALDEAIARDRSAGYHPICVIGNAGTVNTGAIDPLDGLATLCERENMWLHIDGAFGALAALSAELRPALKGMERADSVAFDLHKWMYMPYEVGCILVRKEADHRKSFALTPAYLTKTKGSIADSPWMADYGIQLSRGFRALKVWMSIKEHGIEKYARLIEQNVAQAHYLAELVEAHQDLELLAPTPLNIVCFRFAAEALDGTGLDALNSSILVHLQQSGIAVPSSTVVNGRFAIRVSITNHRTRREDLDLLVDAVVSEGRRRLTAA